MTILIYNDQGVSNQSISHLKNFFDRENLIHSYVSSHELKTTSWMDAKLLIFPGGRDLPYQERLAGKGNQNIRTFVKKGGAFLGICAGAYYGCSSFEFDRNGKLELIEERDLHFFPGKGIGPLFGSYDYESEKSAKVVYIQMKNENLPVYFNGGCYFEKADTYPNVRILARFQENNEAAIVQMNVGKGKVILSGVHFEFSAAFMPRNHPLRNTLGAAEKQREDFFQSILSELS